MSSSARELVLLTTPSPNSKWRRPANLFVDMLALVTVPILVINPVSVILREMPQMVLHPQTGSDFLHRPNCLFSPIGHWQLLVLSHFPPLLRVS